MRVLPISNHKQNTSFNAVVPEYLKRAKREFYYRSGITGDLLFCLETDVYFKAISAQDGLDTLEAIRPYAKNAILALEHVKECFQKYLMGIK